MERNVRVIKGLDGKYFVLINDVIFKGKQHIAWSEVEAYLKLFIGDIYCIQAFSEEVYIGTDLPKEYVGSKYSVKLKGGLAKTKANAAQAIPEMIEIASNKRFVKNFKKKHKNAAKYGWYRYDTRFALPIYKSETEIERYNMFRATLIIRHAKDGKMYLYDVIDIKKEQSTSL